MGPGQTAIVHVVLEIKEKVMKNSVHVHVAPDHTDKQV